MDIKQNLYKKFDIEPLNATPQEIFQQLCAFWQHFALHKRQCAKTGKSIISVHGDDCPYPIWHKEEWIKNADPAQAEYNYQRPFFEQLWELFQECPIPHNSGASNQNCEYTDDWWHSKNCYLSHSGFKDENLSYCYRVVNLKDCQFCAFSFDSELCVDLINCTNCYATTYALNSRQCRDSAFLFDCRNCSNCLFCWNLRDKQYCLFNKQLSKEAYEQERAKYDFSSRKVYEESKNKFFEIIKTKAWWKNLIFEQCENCSGDHLLKCKNCQDCFLIQESEDCANAIRGFQLKDNLNTVASLTNELVYMSSMVQDNCYDIRFGYNLIECKNMQYSAHCFQCKNCFGCCGLVNKQFCIFNKPYLSDEYHKQVAKIITHLKQQGTYGQFFPPHFAACPYEESLAGFHWPLSVEEQKSRGYRIKTSSPPPQDHQYSSLGEIPDSSQAAQVDLSEKAFWDSAYQCPFKISANDLNFCQENNVPLPNQYYLHRLKDNFRMVFFNGELRSTKCAKTGKELLTALPKELETRILSEEAYLEVVR